MLQNGNELTKQESRVLDILKLKSKINPLSSWRFCGVYRLSAVIFNLKEKGYEIKTNRVARKNKFGEKCHFAEYKLET